ncbi:MAG: mechanosensitive ion channel family protein [Bacteroidota bacterium]
MQILFDDIIKWTLDAVPNFLTALAIFLVSLLLSLLVKRLLRRFLERRHATAGIRGLLVGLAGWTIVTIGVIAALQRFFNVSGFLTGLGILGFAVGFALQDVMKNFASGIILILQAPFRAGDTISVAGFDGIVLDTDLRSTEMRLNDGRIVMIPNATILSSPIVNYSRANHLRVELPLAIGWDADPDQAREAVVEAVRSVEGVVDEPAPAVLYQTLSGPAANLTARFWVDTARTSPAAAQDAALRRIKAALQEHGVELQKG